MSRRSSAFDDDLAGLDELARLPLPVPGKASDNPPRTHKPRIPAAEGDGHPTPSPANGSPGVSDPAAGEITWLRTPASGSPATPSKRSETATATATAREDTVPSVLPSQSAPVVPVRRSATTQTAVRLPMAVAKWLSDQANRQQLTFSSVIVQSILAHRHTLAPELPFGDGLLVRRRPRMHSAPITLRLTPAQRQLIDGLAEELGSTRSALVLAALQAAMAGPAEPASFAGH